MPLVLALAAVATVRWHREGSDRRRLQFRADWAASRGAVAAPGGGRELEEGLATESQAGTDQGRAGQGPAVHLTML